ncbi:MAG: pre-peptidase C-terminal domain-containing protein, partial [Gemmatimonadota bacterium]|nr:pre-peptidase C-terminal domain-containing protein [Gemmatimonadota bacterium]
SSDDVGNTRQTATDLIAMPPESSERFTYFRSRSYQLDRGDVDYFRVRLNQRADLLIVSDTPNRSNKTDTYGTLMTSTGRVLMRNDDSTSDPPHFFLGMTNLAAGTYYVEVKGALSSSAGEYELWTGTRIPGAGKAVADPFNVEEIREDVAQRR